MGNSRKWIGLIELSEELQNIVFRGCLVRYIYIIRVPTRNRYNEFMNVITSAKVLLKLRKRPKYFECGGRQPHEFFNSNYLFCCLPIQHPYQVKYF